MNHKFFSNINSTVRPYSARGSGRGIVLFIFEKTHQLFSGLSCKEYTFWAIPAASIVNAIMSDRDQIIYSGGANVV
ncbi:hypothetical protein ACQFX9_04795 [Aliinostoc sp. HNIBRCY26]|uniref:hypothetical protein n=1 Tax=Aliinostoc sp. HNIBRCY26 TaxID=3418997 RepID=UPI003CFBC54D